MLIAGGVIDALGRGQDIGLFTGDTKNLAVKRSRIAGIVILGLVAILVVAWIDGPIRVVRRTKNRQTLFWKIPTPSATLDNIYYANAFEFPTRVDLPFDVDQEQVIETFEKARLKVNQMIMITFNIKHFTLFINRLKV